MLRWVRLKSLVVPEMAQPEQAAPVGIWVLTPDDTQQRLPLTGGAHERVLLQYTHVYAFVCI